MSWIWRQKKIHSDSQSSDSLVDRFVWSHLKNNIDWFSGGLPPANRANSDWLAGSSPPLNRYLSIFEIALKTDYLYNPDSLVCKRNTQAKFYPEFPSNELNPAFLPSITVSPGLSEKVCKDYALPAIKTCPPIERCLVELQQNKRIATTFYYAWKSANSASVCYC